MSIAPLKGSSMFYPGLKSLGSVKGCVSVGLSFAFMYLQTANVSFSSFFSIISVKRWFGVAGHVGNLGVFFMLINLTLVFFLHHLNVLGLSNTEGFFSSFLFWETQIVTLSPLRRSLLSLYYILARFNF